MQHNPSQNPYVAALTLEQRAVLDTIRARSISRFGFDAFRMEGETGGDAGAAAGGTAGDQGQQSAAGQNTQDAGQEQTQQQAAAEPGKVEDLPEWAQKLIRDTRGEAAQHRTKATAAEQQQAQLLAAIGQALGLPTGDQAPKPEELQQQLTASQTAAREAAVKLAVYQTATKHQGDPDALLDSASFLAKVTALDPTANDFAAQVDTAIKEAVTTNPKLRATQAAGSSSADHSPGGTTAPRTPKPLTDAVAGHYRTS